MTRADASPRLRPLTTPKAAALAGVIFAVLFTTSIVIMRATIPEDPRAEIDWVSRGAGPLRVALMLMPLAGIAFLWFVGVVRDRIGDLEDRFFSTVFFGSALVFLAMVFVSAALAGGILISVDPASGHASDPDIVWFGRAVMLQISNTYALRMAGVFMISLATIWLRTGLIPRWLVVGTYLVALTLLLVISLSLWVTLVFPAWVLVVSVFVLVTGRTSGSTAD